MSTATQLHASPQRPGPEASAVALIGRARSLRAQARHVSPVVAEAYLRRAAELRLEAWLQAIRSRPVGIDEFTDEFVTAAA